LVLSEYFLWSENQTPFVAANFCVAMNRIAHSLYSKAGRSKSVAHLPKSGENHMTKNFCSALLSLTLLCGVSAAAHAQVQVFARVPSPEEVRAALTPTPKPSTQRAVLPAGVRARGIDWAEPPSSVTPLGGDVARASSSASDTPPTQAQTPALAFPVQFASGTARVAPVSVAYVAAMAQTMNRYPDMRLSVEGHTDAAGSPHANMVLSWERALAVYRLMVESFGIDPSRLQPAGKGATEPLGVATSPHGLNRRVQFRAMT
jgi:outer membrane protein OmpA-like peptidoglycan-associated protein